jgi:formate hydrogenlyase subunit 6/NADH:ubiquinone oxidoreductase subunit I
MAMERELLKNAFSKPATIPYPFQKRVIPAGGRGKHAYDEQKCTGCGICSRICPAFAIEMKGLGPKCEGIKVNLNACIFCQQCEDNCPTGALVLTSEYELAVINKSDGTIDFKRTPRAPPTPAAKPSTTVSVPVVKPTETAQPSAEKLNIPSSEPEVKPKKSAKVTKNTPDAKTDKP